MLRLTHLFAFLLVLMAPSMFAVSVDIQLRNSGGGTLSDGNTATLTYYDGGWQTATNDGTGTFTISTTTASITYKMKYNNGIQQKVELSSVSPVVFNTVTTTPSLKDSDGIALVGGTVKHYQNGWSSSYSANTTTELLPGNYTFKMTYNNGIEQISGESISGSSDEAAFVTVTTTPSLKDSDGVPLVGGTV